MFFYEVEFISQTKKDSAKRKKIQPNEKSFSQICFSQICFSQYVSAKICFSQTKKDSAFRKKIQPFEKRFSLSKKVSAKYVSAKYVSANMFQPKYVEES
jgi:hypothetical protein